MAPRVLIADDEPRVVRVVSRAFRKIGFSVISVGNGRDAIAAAKVFRPDILVLDIMMPFSDGFQVLTRLRQDDVIGGAPVVMLSGNPPYAFDHPRICPAEQFFVDPVGYQLVAIKPFDSDELAAAARALLTQATTA